jgi:hypothetical protein
LRPEVRKRELLGAGASLQHGHLRKHPHAASGRWLLWWPPAAASAAHWMPCAPLRRMSWEAPPCYAHAQGGNHLGGMALSGSKRSCTPSSAHGGVRGGEVVPPSMQAGVRKQAAVLHWGQPAGSKSRGTDEGVRRQKHATAAATHLPPWCAAQTGLAWARCL